MRDLYIQPAKEGKGRTFRATLLAYVTADALWFGGETNTETTRPVWMMLGGSDNELRPFVANLQIGRKAEASTNRGYSRKNPDRFEVLKSAGFQTSWQRTPVGSVVTLFAPDLFRLDPGMVDPKGIEFCVLPEKTWLAKVNVGPAAKAHAESFGYEMPEDRLDELLRLAPLFIAYLDRRTRCPLVPDQRFYVQVLLAAMKEGLASWSTDGRRYNSYDTHHWGLHSRMGFLEEGTGEVGLAAGIVFKSSHETLERFLAEQVKVYFDVDSSGVTAVL